MPSFRLFPLWKIKRELISAYHQIKAFFAQLMFPVIRFFRINSPTSDIKIIKGQASVGKRIIIFLIFPGSKGLQDRLSSIDYLAASGSVVAVVNGPLNVEDINTLERRCAYVLLRDNKGYDFGGYQAGILVLDEIGCDVDHLHVVNDSVLMPLSQNKSFLSDIEKAALNGFGGAVAMPFDTVKFGSNQLVLSYWLYFSSTTVRSPIFKKYWADYIATNSKVLTVRYGERGLSRTMAAFGFTPKALHTASDLNTVLNALDALTLVTTLKYGSFTDENFESRCDALLAAYSDSAEWLLAARSFILEVSEKRNFLHSFCYLAVAVLDIPFLKKSQMMLPRLMRRQYLTAVQDGALPRPSDHVLQAVCEVSR